MRYDSLCCQKLSVTITFLISLQTLHLFETSWVSETSGNLLAGRKQVNQSKSYLVDRITGLRTIVLNMCKMLKVALLHILLRKFFSAQTTLPHGELEHKL